jgi:hypothetical protein
MRIRLAVVLALALALAACSSASVSTATPGVTPDTTPRGGTLRNVQTRADATDYFTTLGDPAKRIPIGINPGLAKYYLNASDLFVNNFTSSVAGFNTFLGRTPDQLRGLGYDVTGVPNVDARIGECAAEVGPEQTRCWVSLDAYLSASVVPWINLLAEREVTIVPARIVRYAFDQFVNLPALDQIAVRR